VNTNATAEYVITVCEQSDVIEDGTTVSLNMMVKMNGQFGPYKVRKSSTASVTASLVSGSLPYGITYAIVDGELVLSGSPLRAGNGTFAIRVSVIDGGVTTTTTITFVYQIQSLPDNSYGTFEGVIWVNDPVKGVQIPAIAKISIRSTGAASGRIYLPNESLSFRTDGFDGDAFNSDGLFVQKAVAERNGARIDLEMTTYLPGYGAQTLGTLAAVSETGATLMYVAAKLTRNGVAGEIAESTIARNHWRDRNRNALLTDTLNWLKGYYTVSIPSGTESSVKVNSLVALPVADSCGYGYLTVTVSSTGSVRISGQLADGQRVYGTSQLVVTPEGAYCDFMDDPRDYNGGYFMMRLDFITAALPKDTLIAVTGGWVSFNPEATSEYGEGFARFYDLAVAGGYFIKNQYLDVTFENYVSGLLAEYDEWNVETIPVLVNSRGTGFDVPRGGTVDNPAYFSIRASRSTGVISLSFRDLQEGSTRYSTLRGYGVLTPYFQNIDELSEVGGRAYVLENQVHETRGYRYKTSTPLFIMENCNECSDN